jgi:hypothetical protein
LSISDRTFTDVSQKRKAEEEELRKMGAKKSKVEEDTLSIPQIASQQNSISSAWDLTSPEFNASSDEEETMAVPDQSKINTFSISPTEYDTWNPCAGSYLYLLRPQTPALYGKVLTPIHPTWTLKTILQNRVVLEFPTLYALSSPPNDLPEKFMLECHFEDAMRKGGSSHADESDEDSDSDVEEGEIV